MLTEDYFIRYINWMLAAVAKIFGLRTAGQFQEAAQEIQQLLEELFNLGYTIIEDMDDQDLLGLLENEETLDVPRALFAADIFLEKGKVYQAWDSPRHALKSYHRALLFYTESAIAGIPAQFPNPQEKVEEILRILQGKPIPDHLLAGLYQYFETCGSYHKAEQALLGLANLPEWKTEVPSEQKSFYQRLLLKTDQQLEAGGVNRGYLQEQLKTL